MNERQPPPLLTAATADVLRKHAPFDAMREQDLVHLAAALKLRYFAKDASILSPASGRIDALFIIQRGAVQADEPSSVSINALAATLTDGECFPIGALIAGRPTTLRSRALKDTFCYVLDEARFKEVMARSPEFHAFCTRRLAALLAASTRGTREAYSNRAADELTMVAPEERHPARAGDASGGRERAPGALAMQAAFQRYVDNSVSKTVNLPAHALEEDVASIFRQAWHRQLKGITVYRYGSKEGQVLELGAAGMAPSPDETSVCERTQCRLTR